MSSLVRLSSSKITRSSPSALAASGPRPPGAPNNCSAFAVASCSRSRPRTLFEGPVVLAGLWAESPLVAEEGGLVDEGDHVVDGHPLGHPAAQKGGLKVGLSDSTPGARAAGSHPGPRPRRRPGGEARSCGDRGPARRWPSRTRGHPRPISTARPAGPWCATPRRHPSRRRVSRRTTLRRSRST